MEPGSTWPFVVLFILVSLSAVFSAAETALTSLSKIRLRNMVEEKVKNADKISKLVESPSKLLSAILVGNNVVNICASSLATVIAISYTGSNNAVGIATAFMTIVILVFGEITPKTLAAQNSEKIALFVVNFIFIIVKILSPLIYILNIVTGFLIRLLGGDSSKSTPLITEAELKTMVNVSHEEGVLEIDERRMINNVFNFGDSKAKDIMTPRTDISAVEDIATFEDVIDLFDRDRFSRLPVYKDNIDNIIGILHLKDIAFVTKENFSIGESVRDPFFTYEYKSISELFTQMRAERLPLAIILDEYGGTAGLVTIEDMVEEIVGEIDDEYDEVEEDIEVVKEDEFIVDGTTRLEDVNEMIGTRLVSDEFDTIGGYVVGFLGRFPEEGEKIETDNLRITIEEVDKNRIEKIRVYT